MWLEGQARLHSRSGERVVINFYVINNQFEDVPHIQSTFLKYTLYQYPSGFPAV